MKFTKKMAKKAIFSLFSALKPFFFQVSWPSRGSKTPKNSFIDPLQRPVSLENAYFGLKKPEFGEIL